MVNLTLGKIKTYQLLAREIREVNRLRRKMGESGRITLHSAFFFFFRAAPAAYGVSQVRGLIGAVAAGLCQRHGNARS